MDWSAVGQALGPAGLLVAVIVYLLMRDRPANSEVKNGEQQVAFQNAILVRLEKLEKTNAELLQRVSDLEKENQKLRYDLSLMESAHQDLPIPMWLKDENGVMLSVNSAYEALFLLPMGKSKGDYIGNTDYDIWEYEVAEQFGENDRKVFASGRAFNATEQFPVNGEMTDYHIIKYVRYAAGVRIGIAGIAIPPKHSEFHVEKG